MLFMNNNGLLTCAAYAFAPNYYQYCGPDQNTQLLAHLFSKASDPQLSEMLAKFGTLYAYLQTIAKANKITDPFDKRVVEAYWLGNSLLENVSAQDTYLSLLEGQNLKKRLNKKDQKWLYPKVGLGAKLHHSFHVFNVFTRTGHHTVKHTAETMDQCRISHGEILQILNPKSKNPKLLINSNKIVYRAGKLCIDKNIHREISLPHNQIPIKIGDLVSSHWGWYCDHISKTQAQNLEKYTKIHLELANTTL